MNRITAQSRPCGSGVTGAMSWCAPRGRCRCCTLPGLVMVAVLGPPDVSDKMVAVRIRIRWIIGVNSKRVAMRSVI